MGPKFYNFEKANCVAYFADRPDKPINDYLDAEEVEAVKTSLRYGTTEYLENSLLFKEQSAILMFTFLSTVLRAL